MKFYFKKHYILVVSERLMDFLGIITFTGKKAKGAASFPFMVVRSEEYIHPWLVTHELIHFRQQIETLFIGSTMIMILERLYAFLLLKKNSHDAYLWASGEQEAYLNQHNPEYIKTRKVWAQFKYLRNKKDIFLPKAGEVMVR